MKRILLIAAAAASLLACAKTEVISEPHDISVTANAVIDTKTSIAWNGSKYIPSWTAGDKLSVFIQNGDTRVDTNKGYVVDLSNPSRPVFSGSCTAPSEDNTVYTFYAAYPKGETGSTYDDFKYTIPAEQHPTATSFDPAADILVAQAVDRIVNTSTTEISDITFRFTRKTAVLRVCPAYAGGIDKVAATDKIASLEIAFSGDKKWITGKAKLNLSTPLADFAYSNSTQSKTVKAVYDEPCVTVNGGNVFLGVGPCNYEGIDITITILTDKNIQLQKTFTDKNPSFAANTVTPVEFTLDSSWTVSDLNPSGSGKYVKMTSAPEDYCGTYLVVYESLPAVMNANDIGTVKTDYASPLEVKISDDEISSSAAIDAAAVTIVKHTAGEGYTIKRNNETNPFLQGGASDKSVLYAKSAEGSAVTITKNADGDNFFLDYNGTNRLIYHSTNKGFVFIKEDNKTGANSMPVFLYKYTE